MSAKEGLRRIAKIFIGIGALCAALGIAVSTFSIIFYEQRVISSECIYSNDCSERENAAIAKHRAIALTQQEETVVRGIPAPGDTRKKWAEVLKIPSFIQLSESAKLNAQSYYFDEVLSGNVPTEKRPFIKARFMAKNQPGASSGKYAMLSAHDIPASDPFWESVERRPDWAGSAFEMGLGLAGLVFFGLIGWVILGFAGQPSGRSDN